MDTTKCGGIQGQASHERKASVRLLEVLPTERYVVTDPAHLLVTSMTSTTVVRVVPCYRIALRADVRQKIQRFWIFFVDVLVVQEQSRDDQVVLLL